jgi:hypothetical protein
LASCCSCCDEVFREDALLEEVRDLPLPLRRRLDPKLSLFHESSSSEFFSLVSSAEDGDGDGDGDGEGNIPLGDPCDLYEQQCEPGLKCQPDLVDGNHTCQSDGDKAIYDDCDVSEDDCSEGAFCLYTDPEGVCYPICFGTEGNPQCAGGQVCIDAGVPLCVTQCDPNGSDCQNFEGCFPRSVEEEFICVAGSQAIAIGDACASLNDCEFGSYCGPDALCVEYCDTADDICTQGGTCTAWTDFTVPNYAIGVGGCL